MHFDIRNNLKETTKPFFTLMKETRRFSEASEYSFNHDVTYGLNGLQWLYRESSKGLLQPSTVDVRSAFTLFDNGKNSSVLIGIYSSMYLGEIAPYIPVVILCTAKFNFKKIMFRRTMYFCVR